MTLSPFPWRKLTGLSQVWHCLTSQGDLLLRTEADELPFSTLRVRDGQGGFVERPLKGMGLEWVDRGEGWALRSIGEPTIVRQTRTLWAPLVRAAASPLALDERIVFTTIACEATLAAPDAQGLVKAPRTERGYPGRTGETDPGDFERDLEDWRLSGGMHSSHGLMQTLIGTAVHMRPDLFRHVDPAHYRTILWHPEAALACGAAYLASFPEDVKSDPWAVRFHYAAGRVIPIKNRFGARVYDDLVPLRWLAFWNDGAALDARTIAQGSWVPAVFRPPGRAPCVSCGPSPAAPPAWASASVLPPTHGVGLFLSAGLVFLGCLLSKGAHR